MKIGGTAASAQRRTVINLFTLFLTFSLLLGGIVILLYYIDVKLDRTILEGNELKTVEIQSKIIASDFESVVSDLMILAKQRALKNLFMSKDNFEEKEKALKEITETFLAFSMRKKLYDQIRFLNETGMEVIRVNYNDGNPAVVPAEKLQLKFHRYYFRETFALADEELFVSPFDLNIEQEKIEEPIKPVIRFGIPLFDSKGRKRGILLLNYLGKKLLSNLKITSTNGVSEQMLLNADGYWLLNNDPGNEWGFMYEGKKDRTFGNRNPDTWRLISQKESGQVHNKNGLFTFATVYPLMHGPSSDAGIAPGKENKYKAYYWKIISHVPPPALQAASRSIGSKMLFLYLAVVGMLGIGLWVLDRPVINKDALPAEKLSTLFLFFIIAVYMFVAESFVMLVLSILRIESPIFEALVDGSLLVLLISPFLYLFLFRPLILHISERKYAEDELRLAKEQVEEATKLKDKLVSLVSHGLKNPIAGMAGFLKLLNDEVEPVITDKGRKMMDLARKNLFKMTETIEGLLNVSRLKSGQFKPELKFMDAYRLSMKTVVDLGEMAKEKGISLVNKIPKHSRMYADFALLYEVTQNLVTNSIKFCNKGDTITIFIPDGAKSTIAVTDTGVGIEKERLDKLFDYEKKTSTAGTGGEAGTGLGLPLARDIVEAHNGTLRVESVLDKETTFFVDLPFVKPKILLSGEEPGTINEINNILGNLDMELLSVENGSEGMELLKTVTPDLILLSLVKPEHYGFEFLKYLKNSEEYSHIPVVVITSHGEYMYQEVALELGADDFITEPTSPEELIPRVRKHTH